MKDSQIKKLIDGEKVRQKKMINLIASENIVSEEVLEALGSELTNKYAEGYPGKRYYRGQEFTDKVELLAQKRALKIFGLKESEWAVNVQALSGSPANLAIYFGLVPKGGKIMGLNLKDGGHLTHGQEVSITGQFWEPVLYGVNFETELLNYDALKEVARRENPNVIVAGFTAYPRKVDWAKFREIADVVEDTVNERKGAILLADISHLAGLVAGGVYPSPFPYADVVMCTTHKTLRGPRGALIFSRKDKKISNKNISELIDKAVFPGLQGGPHVNNIAAIAVALKEADTPAFKKYTKQVLNNAQVLAGELQKLGWRIVSGGTDSHMILVDTWMDGKGVGGKEASKKLEKAGIICNANTIPSESRSSFSPSGIRLGTPFETTKGKKEEDFKKIARKIDKVLRGK